MQAKLAKTYKKYKKTKYNCNKLDCIIIYHQNYDMMKYRFCEDRMLNNYRQRDHLHEKSARNSLV